MNKFKIALASDHAGFQLKLAIKEWLEDNQYLVKDFGTNSTDAVDYPDYGHLLANSVESGESNLGISVCGSGNGINMTVNKHKGIRGALCWNKEVAALARSHNNANVCSLPGRFISKEEAFEIIRNFLITPFDGGRHEIRIGKIPYTC